MALMFSFGSFLAAEITPQFVYVYIYIHLIYKYDYKKKWGEACVGVGKGTLGLMSIPEAWPQLKSQQQQQKQELNMR
jgi:hypothetical protein